MRHLKQNLQQPDYIITITKTWHPTMPFDHDSSVKDCAVFFPYDSFVAGAAGDSLFSDLVFFLFAPLGMKKKTPPHPHQQ
mmetsp:Transcript_36257/g.62843  ORF Transcript_36257/g.62843 Transcript_36257/m.62843 type:complete len:80 (+) Transcript_36257:330-569(+)